MTTNPEKNPELLGLIWELIHDDKKEYITIGEIKWEFMDRFRGNEVENLSWKIGGYFSLLSKNDYAEKEKSKRTKARYIINESLINGFRLIRSGATFRDFAKGKRGCHLKWYPMKDVAKQKSYTKTNPKGKGMMGNLYFIRDVPCSEHFSNLWRKVKI